MAGSGGGGGYGGGGASTPQLHYGMNYVDGGSTKPGEPTCPLPWPPSRLPLPSLSPPFLRTAHRLVLTAGYGSSGGHGSTGHANMSHGQRVEIGRHTEGHMKGSSWSQNY